MRQKKNLTEKLMMGEKKLVTKMGYFKKRRRLEWIEINFFTFGKNLD